MKAIFKNLVISLLVLEAKEVLKKYQPQIIAITGTVGKTSTKEAIYTALGAFLSVRQSQKNYNSETGVPLTILNMKSPGGDYLGWFEVLLEGLILILFPNHYPKFLILEVGTDRPGDIGDLTKWLKPDVVVVTKLSEVPVHVENFPSAEALFAEKGNLVRALKKDGTLILNADDEVVLKYRDLAQEAAKIVLFGQKSDLAAQNYQIIYEEGQPLGIYFEISDLKIKLLGTLGRQHLSHIQAALAVCKILKVDLKEAVKTFSLEPPTPGRMRLIEGFNRSTIIDDSYNSSPVAVAEALKTLEEVRATRKIAVLGDMLELGKYSLEEHRKAGERAAQIVDILITIGIRSKETAQKAREAGLKEVYEFDDSLEAGKFLKGKTAEGDIILIKGSQGIRAERVVAEIMANPKNKAKLLVRHDCEWQER